jgi:septal ring-binding cell division protein DamX
MDKAAAEGARSAAIAPVAPVPVAATVTEPSRSAGATDTAGTDLLLAGPAAFGRLSRDRYMATQSWLPSAPGGRQSIQLAIFTDAEAARMENFLRQAVGVLNPSELYVYSVKVDGRQHYRVAYGAFASASDIQAALEALPPTLKAQGPFQRSVGEMRRLNQS